MGAARGLAAPGLRQHLRARVTKSKAIAREIERVQMGKMWRSDQCTDASRAETCVAKTEGFEGGEMRRMTEGLHSSIANFRIGQVKR